MKIPLFLSGVALLFGSAFAQPQRTLLTTGWSYVKGVDGGVDELRDDAPWQDGVSVPHAYDLASLNLNDSPDDNRQETFFRDTSWYRRSLEVDFTLGERVYLEFEGAHQVTDLWVNGTHVGQHATGGYTPFHFDITDHLERGEKAEILLKLDNRKQEAVPPDGFKADYIFWGGLYRDVYVVVKDAVHIPFGWEAREAGVMITTPTVSDENATYSIRTTVRNTDGEAMPVEVVQRVIDADDRVVDTLRRSVTIAAGAETTVLQSGILSGEQYHLWSLDEPYLYRVRTDVLVDGETRDFVENPLGFRWFELRPEVGFCINGKPTMLLGVNRHQHYPYIGDAVPDNLHRLDAILMKEAGINLVRLAHYPHDDEFLKACDELGILVAEEAPSWIHIGPAAWMERLEQATRVMIRNHRNHPCVWGWAGGINHRGPRQRLQIACKEEDPFRLTMSNSTLWTGPQHSDVNDLYSVMDYRGAVLPEKGFLFGMEHSGSPNAEGQQRLVSRYLAEPRRIALAAWCGHDGFSFINRGPKYKPLSVWKAALWDHFRRPKPPRDWYQAELLDEPLVRIPDGRAQKPGEVRVFGNVEEVEVFLDGKSVGRTGPVERDDMALLKAPPFVLSVASDPQREIGVKGYRDGEVVAEASRVVAGEVAQLEVVIEERGFTGEADGSSILLVHARTVDVEGRVIPVSNDTVTFAVSGAAELIDADHVGANPAELERGGATVLIRVDDQPGEILVQARKGELSGEANLKLREKSYARFVGRGRPFAELLHAKVDLGSVTQHVEETWSPWHESERYEDPRGWSVRVRTKDGLWTSSHGVPGDLSFMVEDGVTSSGPIELAFAGLAPGKYRLRSWHHRLVGNREGAVEVSFKMNLDGVLPADYYPTFGKKIVVSEAGGGNAGDGGSNTAAAGYATTEFIVREGGPQPVLTIEGEGGQVTLSGFELLEIK